MMGVGVVLSHTLVDYASLANHLSRKKRVCKNEILVTYCCFICYCLQNIHSKHQLVPFNRVCLSTAMPTYWSVALPWKVSSPVNLQSIATLPE